MTFIDVILLTVVCTSGLIGLFLGFVRAAGSLLATIASVYLAFHWLQPINDWLSTWIGTSLLTRIVVFFLLFTLLSRLLGIGVWLLEKVFGLVKWIPLVPTLNRVLGAVLGLLEGVVLATFGIIATAYITQVVLPNPEVYDMLTQSSVAGVVLGWATLIGWFLPATIRDFLM